MNADLGELDLLRDLAARLAQAPHGDRSGLVGQAAACLRVSSQEVYRRLKAVGWTSGRKPRADRGRSLVTREVAKQAAALVQGARRQTGKKTLPLTTTLDILRDNGCGMVHPDTGEVVLPASSSTLSRAMRRYGCHPAMLAQGKPCTGMRSLHPNHVWQVDASLCVLFYLPRQGVQVMPEGVFYKNKPANLARVEKERVWRYVVTDHYSGAFYLRYVQAAGETSENLTETFLQAIQKRGQDDPLNGVPYQLLMDAGSANTSHLFLNLLDRLGVRHLVHMPGNSRVKGQVEQAQNLVETQFEGRLAYLRIETLEQLQAAADKWRMHYNAWAVHGRTGKTRNAVWLSITEEQLRLAPDLELCRDLVTTKPVEATVRDDMTITHATKRHGRHTYDLRYVPGLAPKMKVTVVVNPYRAPACDVITTDERGDEAVWTVEPVELTEAGFRVDAPVIGQEHQALPDTVADRNLKEIEAAGAVAGRQSGEAPYGLDVMADLREAPAYIPRRGRDLGLDASRREIPPLSHVEAAAQIKDRVGGAWTAESYAWLTQRYPDGVPADAVDDIAAQLTGPAQTKAVPLRLAAQGGL